MNTKIFLSAAIFALTVTAACSDDKDTTGPEINLLQPQNEEAFTRGDTLTIEFEVADSSGIKGYKIDIHYAGGEHAHTHALSATPTHEETEVPWEYEFIQDGRLLDGYKEGATHVRVFTQPVIPADAQEGEYHLGVIATDMLGNESQLYIDIVIKEE